MEEMGGKNPLQTPSSEPSRLKRPECPSSPQPRPTTEPSRWKRLECPSSTQSRPRSVTAQMLGTLEDPVNIAEDGDDKKPIIDPLSRLRPFWFPNQEQVPSQNSSEESVIIKQMKKLLVSKLFAPNNITMDINAMIDHANGTFHTLAYLWDNDVAFYDAIRSYIYWYQEWVVADALRNRLCKEIIDQHEKLEINLKKAEEGVQNAESNLSIAKNAVALVREKIRNLEQELVQREDQVVMLAVEKEKWEQFRHGVNAGLKAAVAKGKESEETLKKIDDRRKAAVSGISEMRKLLKSFSI